MSWVESSQVPSQSSYKVLTTFNWTCVYVVYSRQEDYASLQAPSLPTWIPVSTMLSWWASFSSLTHSFYICPFWCLFLLCVLFTLQKFSVQSAWFVKNLYSSAAACLVIPCLFFAFKPRFYIYIYIRGSFWGIICVISRLMKIYCVVTGLLQLDSVSGSWEHVCDEHALLQQCVHRCLWSLQYHFQIKGFGEHSSRHFLLVINTVTTYIYKTVVSLMIGNEISYFVIYLHP